MKDSAKRLRKLLSKEVLDIILFGSYTKGKISPQDIDVAVLAERYSRNTKEKIIEFIPKADVQFISLADYDKRIWLTLIREGFSVRHMKYLSEIYGIRPIVLFKYSLKSLSNSNKVMFQRALNGFTGIKRLSNRVVQVPENRSAEFEDLLRHWEIDIDSQEYHLLPLLRKS